MVVLDGSRGEGGGQILRNAISYATILKSRTSGPLEVINIRAGRSKPGLAAQHVTGLRLATQICGGVLRGGNVRSERILYTSKGNHRHPADADANTTKNATKNATTTATAATERTIVGDIGTAGSICLLLQAALPCALFGSTTPCTLILKGGTNASMAPQYDYWNLVFLPILQEHFLKKLSSSSSSSSLPSFVTAQVIQRGFFPRGGGEVHVRINPLHHQQQQQLLPIPPIHLTERGEVCHLYVRSYHAGKVPMQVAQDMAAVAQDVWRNAVPFHGTVPIRVDIVTEQQAQGSGSGIILVAKTKMGCLLAGSALGGGRKRTAGDVGKEAANELLKTLRDGGCVDEWMQDQLILFMALAKGTSEILTGSLTLHTQTAILVAEELCGATFTVTNLSAPVARNEGTVGPDNGGGCGGRYGKGGRVPGKHIIRCEGIAFENNATLQEDQDQNIDSKRQKNM